jgi:hypothetical protein
MKKICFLLFAAMAAPALAGDLWEITSMTTGPDGAPISFTEKKCLPKDGMTPSQALGNMGNCVFDSKSGDDAAMNFSMTCKMQGMPPELSAMKVTGDAKLDGDKFSMHYTLMAVTTQDTPGSKFTMTGQAEARKTGQCKEN